MKARILLVEDDANLARGLQFNLEREGFTVTWVDQGRAAMDGASASAFDLVILDLSLPDVDGTEVLTTLRARGATTAVICLTARGSETDKVMGLQLGADDYVTKPFGIAELVARIQAVLRRTGTAVPRDVLTLGRVHVDLGARTANHGDRTEELTGIETDLLRYLAARPGHAVDRAQILRDLWGVSRAAETRTLDNHIARLRRKIEADPAAPRFLVTVHGHGYRLDLDARGS